MEAVSIQYVLDKAVEALTKVAELIGSVNRESQRIDGIEDDHNLLSRELDQVEKRLREDFVSGLQAIRAEIAADAAKARDDAAQAARDKVAARSDRAALVNGLIHSTIGAAAGVFFAIVAALVAHRLHLTLPLP